MMSVLWSASKRLFFRQLQNRPFSPVSLPTSNNQARRSLSPPSGHQSHYTTQANLTQPLLEKRQGNGFLKKEAKEAGKGNVRYSYHLHPLKFGFQDPAAPNCPLKVTEKNCSIIQGTWKNTRPKILNSKTTKTKCRPQIERQGHFNDTQPICGLWIWSVR